MLLYDTSKEFRQSMSEKQVKVYDYKLNKDGNLMLTLVDEKNKKKLIVSASDFKIDNESFEIKGQNVTSLLLRGFTKYFKSSYFVLAEMTISDSSSDKVITISGGGLS